MTRLTEVQRLLDEAQSAAGKAEKTASEIKNAVVRQEGYALINKYRTGYFADLCEGAREDEQRYNAISTYMRTARDALESVKDIMMNAQTLQERKSMNLLLDQCKEKIGWED